MMNSDQMKDWLQEWLENKQEEMVLFLEKLVNIDSYSHDQEDIHLMVTTLYDFLFQAGIHVHVIEEFDSLAVKASVGHVAGSLVFLTGHLDTVFKKGTVKQRPFCLEENKAYGPGVADMKSGIVMNAFILVAMSELDKELESGLPFSVTLFATTDEEIGSPKGRHLIEKYLPSAVAVFNAEPGRISGNLVAARKGGASYQIDIKGKAAHAGVSHADGISAIEIMAHIITRIHQLTDYQQGITTNIGVIDGGTTPNTVAELATAKLDVRFMTLEQGVSTAQQIEQIVAHHAVNGAQASLIQLANFLPFEVNMSAQLLTIMQQEAHQLGFSVDGEYTGGCSDAGWTASMGIPTICGTGPVGAYMHTDREYCLVDTFVERATLVARATIAVALN
ncbi:M20 family metallopeptidase [Vibrio spartinae]|uniref:Carboxypeptidase G2 n=1 Tax=Vibrio spartinae TaxID=1918945 RepID=A0A1N6M712_9VIBR|nr:M20 family metallopeptidase [Vibrio spartinae]QMV13884.1 Carboxypeptidase G2 precursor [Vibrio spartinae]SIO95147.1 Carboxypeptidase G2 precursor [Vibrio spartinae]